jgi:hypothetical protein
MFTWNKWTVINQIAGKGKNERTHYNCKMVFHDGLNYIRVFQKANCKQRIFPIEKSNFRNVTLSARLAEQREAGSRSVKPACPSRVLWAA